MYQDIQKKIEPDHVLYGLNYLQQNPKYKVIFSDIAYSRLNLLYWLLLPIQRLLICKTSLGFKLDQALLLFFKILKADCLITTADSAGLPVLFLKKIGLFKKPIIYISIGLANELNSRRENVITKYYLSLLEEASFIICHSLVEEKLFLEMNPNLKDKIIFIPFGIDTKFFTKPKSESDFILSIGYDRSRDYKLLAELTSKMKNQQFIIIAHKVNIKSIHFGSNVKLFFNLPYHQVRDYLLKAKLVIIPLKELKRASGQMSFLEAVSSQNKIVIASIKGIMETYPDIFKHNENIFTYQPGSLSELADSVKKALEYKSKNFVKLPLKYTSEGYYQSLEKLLRDYD